MKKKWLVLLIGLLLLPLVWGCGFKDIDKRYFVVSMGFDASKNEEKPYLITLSLAVPTSKIEPGNSRTLVLNIETASIAEGLRELKSHVDKELDFGHCKIFIIGQELANKDIRNIVSWMTRRRDISNVATISEGVPTAQQIVRFQPESERYPGNALNLHFSSDASESTYTYIETLSDLNRRILEKGLDPLLPIIYVNDNKQTYVINQLALFNKQNLQLTLSPEETEIFNHLAYHFSKPNSFGSFRSDSVVVEIDNIKRKYKIVKEDPNITVVTNLKLTVTIEEFPYDKERDWKEISKRIEEAYSAQVLNLLYKIRDSKVDPIGFGLKYRAMYGDTKFEEKWPAIYEQIKFQVNTTVDIKNTGLIK